MVGFFIAHFKQENSGKIAYYFILFIMLVYYSGEASPSGGFYNTEKLVPS
jgi:hypothetical protein